MSLCLLFPVFRLLRQVDGLRLSWQPSTPQPKISESLLTPNSDMLSSTRLRLCVVCVRYYYQPRSAHRQTN
ncbi:hypothetical protein IW262DRAFT_433839 [Armillaria fumosa]|nr:hypothetical protein IW262DRAFT_433839 [Armillaria fumosa]